jgi:hypothetical protein
MNRKEVTVVVHMDVIAPKTDVGYCLGTANE